MRYVEIDPETGAVSWESYFDYLSSARTRFSPDLYHYIANREHYKPEGRNSLHGGWLIGVQLGYRSQDLVLAFVGPWHDRKHVMTYVGVKSYTINLEVGFRAGERDVLAHEFRVEERLVIHEVAFRNSQSLRIICEDVLPVTEVLS